jgi:hypothetical protein
MLPHALEVLVSMYIVAVEEIVASVELGQPLAQLGSLV